MKIDIVNKFGGEVLFSYECNNNSVKKTLEKAVKKDTVLRGADLRDTVLRGADLRGADLRYADLRDADLRGADLEGAVLRYTVLRGADLRGADLRYTVLRGADLRGAVLRDADLEGADLRYADHRDTVLRGADLRDAVLRYTDLRGADLRDADLRDADLRDADLRDADLRDTENILYIPFACPSDGEFTAWKKVNGKLVQLLVPADAKRSSATTNKCRCDKAMVVAITDLDGNNPIDELKNNNYAPCKYVVGEMVYPDKFDENRWNECSNGIHFFINKQDAINY